MGKSWHLPATAAALCLGLCGVLAGCSESLNPWEDTVQSDAEPAVLAGNGPQVVLPDPGDEPCGEPVVVPLLVGRGRPMGSIRVCNDETTLYVTIEPSDGWVLMQTRLAVATSLDKFPRPIRPRVSDLMFRTRHDRLSSYTYEIPLEGSWYESGQELYMALSAVLLETAVECTRCGG